MEMNLVLEKLVIPYAIDICPDLTIIQGGADCLKDDPQSKISLSNLCYWQTISKLKDFSKKFTHFKGGGGYNPYITAKAWVRAIGWF